MAENNISQPHAPKMTVEQLWLIVGSVAAVLAILVSIGLAVYGFYFAHHEASKGIEATVISRAHLLNPEIHKKPSDLHLFYKHNEIFDLGIIQIRIRNSGAQPITQADIEQPLTLTVKGAIEIISSPVVQTHPLDLPIQTTISGTKIELSKALLNPDDSFTIEIDAITTEGDTLDISDVSGRFAGVQSIVFRKSLPEETRLPLFALSALYKAIPIGVISLLILVTVWMLAYGGYRKGKFEGTLNRWLAEHDASGRSFRERK